MSQALILLAIVTYLAFMLYVGFVFSKKNETVDDFYLGGRTLGPYVTAMSAEASDMSSWLLMGLPGVAYVSGLASAGWTAIGLALGTYLNWLIVAKRIRRYSQKLDAITVPQFFSKRYGDDRSILSAIAGIIIVVFFIPYTASGFAACGKLFASIFGMNYLFAMIISAVVIVAYTVLGGFLAASATDLVQSIIMTIALAIVMIFAITQAGGIDVVMENANSLMGYLSFTATHIAEGNVAEPVSVLTIVSTLAWGLGYCGMPHILLRFMAIGDVNKLGTSRRVATSWVVVSMAIALSIGVIGNAMTAVGTLPQLEDSETIIVQLAHLLSMVNPFFALVAGVILAGILAATMSTADSQLLAASSSISQNIGSEFLRIDLSGKRGMLVARLTMVVISMIAVFLARDPNSSVFGIVSFAWAGFGGAFGPVVLLSLFWKRGTMAGALAGMLCGGGMVFVWKYLVAPMGGVFAIYELLPAFIVGGVVMIVVSLLTPPPSAEIVAAFEEVNG